MFKIAQPDWWKFTFGLTEKTNKPWGEITLRYTPTLS